MFLIKLTTLDKKILKIKWFCILHDREKREREVIIYF